MIDCDMSVLLQESYIPGDDLYPAEPDMEGKDPAPDVGQSYAESIQSAQQCHRLELRQPFVSPIRCNIPATHGHVTPMLLEEFEQKFGSGTKE